MAELLAAVTWIGACFLIGLRLIVLAARTRETPELLIGVSFLLAGVASGGLSLLRSLAALDAATHVLLGSASIAFLHSGIALVAAFTWRVFRPGRLGAVLFALLAFALATGAAGEIVNLDPRPNVSPTAWFWFSVTARTVVYGWSTLEALRYWRLLRRRAQLGLADPLVTHRVLLWGIGSLSITVLWLRVIFLGFAAPGALGQLGSFATTALILACAASFWLAFFPPAAYLRHVRQRAAAG